MKNLIRAILSATFLAFVAILPMTSAQAAGELIKSDFYWTNTYFRGIGSPPINDNYIRPANGTVHSSCQGDYPKHVGARCFKNPVCTDRKGKGNSWGYDFDGATTCWRKKDGDTGTPKSYPADSKGESIGCNGNDENIAGLCYSSCRNGYQKTAGLACSNVNNGKCTGNGVKEGLLCFPACQSGYNGVQQMCIGQTPAGYRACGLGFAKSDEVCAWVTGEQVVSVGLLAAGVGAEKAHKAKVAADLALAAKRAGKTTEAIADMAKELMRLDIMSPALFKSFAEVIAANAKNTNEMIDAAKAGKPFISKLGHGVGETMTRMKPVIGKLLTVFGSYKGVEAALGVEDIKDDYALVRYITGAMGLIHGVAELSCLVPPVLAGFPEVCKAVDAVEPVIMVTDIVGAYTFPVYGARD